jgi:GT2 family glycosyltransferase
MSHSTTRSRPAIVGLEALTKSGGLNGVNGSSDNNPVIPWKVAVVIPCFNRRSDLELILRDVARQDLRPVDGRPIRLWCVVVDNASTEPLHSVPTPPGLQVEFVRLEKNVGGSGGFNAGMSQVLSGSGLTGEIGQPDFLWWLDSDARAARTCLRELVKVLARRPKVGGVGSALGDIPTGEVWETGARIVRRTGYIRPVKWWDKRFLLKADYLAACSGLVRRTAIEQTGLFPENFIYYDDIDWCIQMTAKTGMRIVGAPRSRAYHPPGNRRYVTWGRYYIARNGFSHIDAMKLGGWVRFRRAMREVPRAVAQAIMGIDELAQLHLRGLQDAVDKNFPTIEPRELVKSLAMKPFRDIRQVVDTALAEAGGQRRLWVHPLLKSKIAGLEGFRREVTKLDFQWPPSRRQWRHRTQYNHLLQDALGALRRMVAGPTAEVAVVPTGWPTSWFRGKVLIQVTTEGLIVRTPTPRKALLSAAKVLVRGVVLAAKVGLRGPHVMKLPAAPQFRARAAARQSAPVAQAL